MLIAGLLAQTAGAQKTASFRVRNPLNSECTDELVVLKRKDIEKKLGAVPEGKFLTVTAAGKPVVVQLDDVTGDRRWDEALFLHSFGPKEAAVFKLAVADKGAEGAVRAHVRLKKKAADDSWGPAIAREEMPLRRPATDFSKNPLPDYLTEGPAWENDKVAFRLYLDVRNNKDIYGKTTARMVLDSVGTKAQPSYHELHDWGMDILHVVKSLGAGALALQVPRGDGTDTLIRLGGQNVKRTVYEALADGPVRARFRMTYDWEVGGKPVQVAEEIRIWGGQYFYESKVTVKGAPAGTKLVTGIADFYDNVFQCFPAGSSQVVFSHGRQSENKDFLGMAILMPRRGFAFAGSAPAAGSEVLTSWLAAQDIREGAPCTYRYYAGWERTDQRFARLPGFRDFLREQAVREGQPVTIHW
ncbi:DUF4861 domain-containing protein [Paraflavisolibacter sp. H34]|uniref:DUF4861 domain-containing protein n=1 Tax=Huijunlia imazamoxiresistens TaxID=3127457 RepID=UPI0030161F13